MDDYLDGTGPSLDSLDNVSLLPERIIDESETDDELRALPVIETLAALEVLDSQIISSADEEAVEFLIDSAIAKIWNHTFLDEKAAIEQLRNYDGTGYSERVRSRFLEQFDGAKTLIVPDGYSFAPNGIVTEPNLMQRLTAHLVSSKRRFGNWSGTGAGKTLSAILASRIIGSKVTMICCPNAVVKGWRDCIKETFPDSVVHTKNFDAPIKNSEGRHVYLVFNYESFQQENSEYRTKALIDRHRIEFVVIDEIHQSKQRTAENHSRRKKVIAGLLSAATEKNPDLYVLGMSATPVINNLYEGKSLLELINGLEYSDLKINPNLANCMSLYQKLVTNGICWMPRYEQVLDEQLIEVDCSEYVDDIRVLAGSKSMVDLEEILTRAKLPVIKENIRPKTLIYTHYVQGIAEQLRQAIAADGWKVGMYTGEEKGGLEDFIKGDLDVLIASSAVATGVDGLQRVCNRMIINSLPWTHAEYEQLRGRVYRQGQKQERVEIIIPLTYADVAGQEWSWCRSRWNRILFKKSIADAAVDGIVPEGHLRSPAQAYQDVMSWLERLDKGIIHEVTRRKIHIPLSDKVIQTRTREYGDFSKLNNRINSSRSERTHERFRSDPKEWEHYHALYREARKSWPLIPYEEIVKWFQKRPEMVVGDFGCGEAKLAELLINTVYSFDHVAINENVTACDISHVSLDSESLDAAVFSLSLMGSNFTDYIVEARRCLKLDGHLHIAEATSRFSDLASFTTDLSKLGFYVLKVEQKSKFTFIHAIKNEEESQILKLSF
ncbi:hypothetical protein BH10ACI2_BH10ACI2_21730 [soil metagenome]